MTSSISTIFFLFVIGVFFYLIGPAMQALSSVFSLLFGFALLFVPFFGVLSDWKKDNWRLDKGYQLWAFVLFAGAGWVYSWLISAIGKN